MNDENEKNINTFEEAGELSAQLFNSEENPETVTEGNGETPTEPESSFEQNVQAEADTVDEAVKTAEIAAQTAAQKDMQIQELTQDVRRIQQQNENLQQTLAQMSDQQREAVVDEVMDMPILDFAGLAFDDEDTIKQKQSDYAKAMADYIKGSMNKELEPLLVQAKEGLYQKERDGIIEALSGVPELNGIKDMLPQLDRIIENNAALSNENVPIDEKYITAYAIAKGVNSINTPPPKAKDPTAEELMQYYESNTDFQDLIEKRRIESLKKNQQVPNFSASSGAVNAALNIKKEPKNFEEASERTRKMFGIE